MIFHLCVTGCKLCCSLNCAKRVQSINKAWSMWLPGPVSFEWVTWIVALAAGVFDASFRVFENIFFNWRLIAIDENKRQGRVNLHSIPSSRRYHVSLAPSRHNKWSESLFYGVFCSPLPYPTRLELGSFQNDSALELKIQPDQARTVVGASPSTPSATSNSDSSALGAMYVYFTSSDLWNRHWLLFFFRYYQAAVTTIVERKCVLKERTAVTSPIVSIICSKVASS